MNYPLNKEEKNWSVFIHLLAFSVFIIPPGFILGPLILWLMKKEESHYIDFHGKQAINFQISFFLYALGSSILIIVAIGVFLLMAVIILWFVFTIIAAVKASEGECYRYPLSIPFIK